MFIVLLAYYQSKKTPSIKEFLGVNIRCFLRQHDKQEGLPILSIIIV